ncbi:MAG: amidohydrolase family protein [Candidatus Xenobiia bacterium LiM19]
MKKLSFALVPLILLATTLLNQGCATAPVDHRDTYSSSGSADLVILNADVFTSHADNPRTEAVAVEEGRICYVGDNAGAARLVGSATRLIDAQGKMLTPGFVDNHCHVLWIGAILSLVPSDSTAHENLDQFLAAVRKQAQENPDLPFVNGGSWHYRYIPGGKPDRKILDEILPDRAVISGAYDGQGGWANTQGLNIMRERNFEAFADLGPVQDEMSGEYTGEFRHFHAFNPFDFFTLEEFGPGAGEKMMETMAGTLRDALSTTTETMSGGRRSG